MREEGRVRPRPAPRGNLLRARRPNGSRRGRARNRCGDGRARSIGAPPRRRPRDRSTKCSASHRRAAPTRRGHNARPDPRRAPPDRHSPKSAAAAWRRSAAVFPGTCAHRRAACPTRDRRGGRAKQGRCPWKLSTVCALGLSWSSAIRKLRRKASARACGLGTKPNCSIAFSTAARVLSVRNSERLITRLTVFFETPASAATSLIVGCLPPGPLVCAAIFALSPASLWPGPRFPMLMGARKRKINRPAGVPTPLDTGYHQI